MDAFFVSFTTRTHAVVWEDVGTLGPEEQTPSPGSPKELGRVGALLLRRRWGHGAGTCVRHRSI